jgi:hypothetical protein
MRFSHPFEGTDKAFFGFLGNSSKDFHKIKGHSISEIRASLQAAHNRTAQTSKRYD